MSRGKSHRLQSEVNHVRQDDVHPFSHFARVRDRCEPAVGSGSHPMMWTVSHIALIAATPSLKFSVKVLKDVAWPDEKEREPKQRHFRRAVRGVRDIHNL